VELVVAGDELAGSARIRVFLKDDEVLQQIEEPLRLEHAPDERLELKGCGRRMGLAIDAAPQLEPLLVGGERADAGLETIAHHQGGVLELNQAEGEPVEKQHQVWPAVELAVADAELVHHQPVIRCIGCVQRQPHMVACDAAIGSVDIHRHAITHEAVEGAVGLHERGCGKAQQLAESLFAGIDNVHCEHLVDLKDSRRLVAQRLIRRNQRNSHP